jgi:hypothetical protein
MGAINEPGPLARALDYLEQQKVIRRRVDADTRLDLYLLEHDYLCLGLLEAERRARRWQTETEDARQRFERAGTWWGKWQALLSPWRQAVLLYQGWRGQFTYAGLRAFVLLSLLRFLPYAAVGIVLIIGWRQWRDARQNQFDQSLARELLALIGNSDDPSQGETGDYWPMFAGRDERGVFWRIAQSGENVRFHFLQEAMQPGNAVRFFRRSGRAVQAAVQLNSDLRRRVVQEILLPGLEQPSDNIDLAFAEVALGRELEIEEDSAFAAQCGRAATANLLSLLQTPRDDRIRLAVVNRLYTVMEWLPEQEAQESARLTTIQLLDDLQSGSPGTRVIDVYTAGQIVLAMRKVAGRLSEPVAGQLLQEFQKKETARSTNTLWDAMRGLAGRLSNADARKTVAQFLPELQKEKDSYACATIATALIAVAEPLPEAEAQQIAQQVVQKLAAQRVYEMQNVRVTNDGAVIDGNAREVVEKALQGAARLLSQPDAHKAADQLLLEFQKKPTDAYMRLSLAEVLVAVAARLSKSEAQQFARQVVAQLLPELPKLTGSDKLDRLETVLGALSARLPEAEAQKVAQALGKIVQIIPSFQTDGPTYAIIDLARKALAGPLSEPEARRMAAQLLPELQKKELEAYTRCDVAAVLKEVVKPLPDAEAHEIAQQVAVQFLLDLAQVSETSHLGIYPDILAKGEWSLDLAQLFNLLKHPLLVGKAREYLVNQFDARFAKTNSFKGKLWRLVAWVQQYRPDLDLKSPPEA